MNDIQKQQLITWLNDAHAMELALVENLQEKSKDAETAGKTNMQEKIDEHLEQTKQHAVKVEACVKRLGGDLSRSKEVMGKMTGYLQGVMKSLYDDVMVKNALESHAAEHFEIAAYTSLIAAAKAVGDKETTQACEQILTEEKEMAKWTETQIPIATTEYIMSKK